MSPSLIESLELEEIIYSRGNAIVVHQNGSIDGEFVLHFIVGDFIRRFPPQGQTRGSRVILVLTHQSITHWTAIANKIGYNLNSAIQKEDFVVIDLVNESYKSIQKEPNTENPTETEDSIICPLTGCPDLLKLYHAISHRISDFGVNEKLLIVIEDLSSLLYQGDRTTPTQMIQHEKNVIDFLCKLKKIAGCGGGGSGGGAVLTSVTSSHDSVHSNSNRFADCVSGVLSQVCIQVSPLSTGFSPQITGYLTVRNKIDTNKSIKSNHYKLEDRNVKITPIHS